MKKIAIEEHFFTQEYMDYLYSRTVPPRREFGEDANHNKFEVAFDTGYRRTRPLTMTLNLLDLEKGRLSKMDRAGIDMQVLSLASPGTEAFSAVDGTRIAHEVNNSLGALVNKYPDRYAGWASLAPQDPSEAAAELERAVKELGLKGANINSHINGEYLDDKKFWVIFKKAQELNVPIYLHPREPSAEMIKPYAKYPDLMGSVLGFSHDGSLHAMRLISSGVFDEFPKLRIILGHLGEALPIWLWRLDHHWRTKGPKKKPSEYFRENFLVSSSGMYWDPPFKCVYEILGADSILFATDCPFESMETAVKFINEVPIPDGDKEKICHLNAEKLLGLSK